MVKLAIMSLQRIGVISDTHDLLRPAALDALQGCELILHAGDVGRPEVLDALSQIAPLVTVRGNVDNAEWARCLPPTLTIETGAGWLYMLHNLHDLDLDPSAAGFAAVISGHSHQPLVERRQGVLYLNPGSAGPRRFALPVTLALLHLTGNSLEAELIDLEAGRA